METISDGVAAAAVSVDVAGWVEEFACGFARIAARFSRWEPRLQARSFLLGVLTDVDTRSCWQLAEQAGDDSPRAMQRLLGEAVWDADTVRDDVRGYVVDMIADHDADDRNDEWTAWARAPAPAGAGPTATICLFQALATTPAARNHAKLDNNASVAPLRR